MSQALSKVQILSSFRKKIKIDQASTVKIITGWYINFVLILKTYFQKMLFHIFHYLNIQMASVHIIFILRSIQNTYLSISSSCNLQYHVRNKVVFMVFIYLFIFLIILILCLFVSTKAEENLGGKLLRLFAKSA